MKIAPSTRELPGRLLRLQTAATALMLALAFLLVIIPAAMGDASIAPEYAPGILRIQLTTPTVQNAEFSLRAAGMEATHTGVPELDAVLLAAGLERVRTSRVAPARQLLAVTLGLNRQLVLTFPRDTDMIALADRVANLPQVEWAAPDWVFTLQTVPNDPLYPDQWGHDNQIQFQSWDPASSSFSGPLVGTLDFDADIDDAWSDSQGYGSSSIIIAIIDSGVDLQHPDLTVVSGYDFGENDADPSDSYGHGTAAAGVAAANGDNGIGPAGVCPNCRIMPLKVSNAAGGITASAVGDALVYAADHGARVASMSFGLGLVDPMIRGQVNYADSAGVTLFAATGNNNLSHVFYPAAYPKVVAVGAASPCGERKRSANDLSLLSQGVVPDPMGVSCDNYPSWGSNYGPKLDLMAPTIIPTTDIHGIGGFLSGDYLLHFDGTSAACPFAAGVAGLLLSKDPSLAPGMVKQRLFDSATDMTAGDASPGFDTRTGWGLVNADAALSGD